MEIEKNKIAREAGNEIKNSAELKKPFLKKFWYLGIILIFGLLILSIFIFDRIENDLKRSSNQNQFNEQFNNKYKEKIGEPFAWPNSSAKYITAVPVDLTQIQSISKYRSCTGHIRDGYNFDRALESDRSMKHYLYPIPQFQGTIDKVKAFAPFDGSVADIQWEKDKVNPRDYTGNTFTLSTSEDKNARFIFQHIYFVKEFKIGDKVKAGELVGYASLADKGNDFDIDLTAAGRPPDGREILGSFFDHAADNVLDEFKKYGITPDNTKFSRDYRDANPCGYSGADMSNSEVCPGRENECWVKLKH